jgi:hypothetical protein
MCRRACGGEEPSANRMRPLAHDGAHATAAVSRARIKSSYQPSTLRACVGKAPLSFPATVPSTTSDAFHSQTPIVSSGYLRSAGARDREPARARGSTRHTRGSDTPSAAGTTAQLYTYIRARPYVLVGATFVSLYLSSVGVGTRKALLWLSERGSLVAPGRPNAKKPTLERFPLHRRKPGHPRRRQLAHLHDDREPCTNKLVEPAGPKRHSSWADDCQMKTLT